MDITSKLVTTKVHTAAASVDVLKGVAIAAVVHQLGLAPEAVVSSSAEVGEDGSITVEVVEDVTDPAPAPAPQSSAGFSIPGPTAPIV